MEMPDIMLAKPTQKKCAKSQDTMNNKKLNTKDTKMTLVLSGCRWTMLLVCCLSVASCATRYVPTCSQFKKIIASRLDTGETLKQVLAHNITVDRCMAEK